MKIKEHVMISLNIQEKKIQIYLLYLNGVKLSVQAKVCKNYFISQEKNGASASRIAVEERRNQSEYTHILIFCSIFVIISSIDLFG